MFATIKAKYENGVLTPLEALDLEEGEQVSVMVVSEPSPQKAKPAATESEDDDLSVNGLTPEDGLPHIVAKMREWQSQFPPEAWVDIPTDSAKNYKHYLYGFPKEQEEA